MTPRAIFEAYMRRHRIGFVAYRDPKRGSEPITLFTPHRDVFSQGPESNFNWDVDFIGAGRIEGEGPWHFEVQWGSEHAVSRFGRSHPVDGAAHARAEQTVVQDFVDFLRSASESGWFPQE